MAKLQYTDRLPDWFLKSLGAKEAADQSKELSKEECREISNNVGAAIAKEAADRAAKLHESVREMHESVKQERKRTREEADRASASGAGPSTVNNVTININCQAPPSKRLLTDCLSIQ